MPQRRFLMGASLMKRMLSLGIVLLLSTTCNCKSYKDHSLVYATPTDQPVLDFFMKLETFYNVTFWTRPSLVNKSVEFSISRANLAELTRDTKDMDIDFLIVIRDLQSVFDNQTIKPYVRRNMESFDWQSYHSVDDINDWLRDLSENYPNQVKLVTIGRSIKNRNILAVKLKLENYVQPTRSKVIIEGGCHAREWISPAVVTYILNSILKSSQSTNDELRRIARAYEWIFIPSWNPDGYEYSQTTDRLWRKNLRNGYGIDLNRNFGISFGKNGCSKSTSSEEYCGPNAFSEPESTALANFVKENGKDLLYYVAFHSFGQYIIIPYAYMENHIENFDEVALMASSATDRSMKHYGIGYKIGTAYDTVGYFASGITADWVKSTVNVPYVVTIELPDQGQHGFALPPSRIQSTCIATMDMLLDFLNPKTQKLRDSYQTSRGYRSKVFWEFPLFIFICLGLNL